MGKRFSTPGDVREHWFNGADAYRVSETKAEADQRCASARSRAHRALDEELVGEALVIARVERSSVPTPDQYRWGVFHAGTALPVLMLESGQGAERAREVARAIDAWRDPEGGEPFGWDSDGLSDRLRSPYGRGMLDQARGREPGQRWDEPPPAETQEWETGDGQTYTYGKVDRELRVFAPGGLLIARAASRFDVSTKKEAWIGETRDGRRLAGKWERHFVEHAVQQHLIAQREPADRDDLWIHYNADRAMVHGSDRHDTDLEKVMRSAGFTWSGNARAYVTAGTTRPVARAQGVDRLARALYEEGRAVEIRADEDRLRGIFAPAASGPAVGAAAAGRAPAPPVPVPEPVPVLAPEDLTDELLAAELTRLTRERDAATYGGTRRRRLDEQLAPLTEERRKRVVASYRDRPDPAGMTEEELTAERDQFTQTLRIPSYGPDPVREAQQERSDQLAAEQARRLAAELEARPPVLQMTDDDLRAEGEILAKGRYDVPAGMARDAFDARRETVGVEIADRHLRTWEPAQVPVGELDDIELTEAIETLRRERLHDSGFAGHYASKQRIEQAHEARLHVLRAEQKKRDMTAFETLLKTDGRIRLESRSHVAGVRDDDVRVFIDGRWYGDLSEGYPGWRTSVVLGRGVKNETIWRTEALSWLIEQYEASPETRDTRTWGPVVDVELPPSLVEHLITRNSEYTGTNDAEKYLLNRMVDSPRSQSWDETGKKMMVHALDLPERTLPVLERMGRLLVVQLDEELDSDDRKTKERAKRSRPNVLRGLDDIRETMQARGLEPLTDAAAPQDGETNGERVRADGPTSLDDVPAPGAGADPGQGAVLRGAGDVSTGTDRRADAGADGRGDGGDGPRPAGGEAESRAADGEGAGPAGDRAGGAGGGEPERGAAPVAVRFRSASQDDLAPEGKRAKAHANLAAVRTLKQVQAEERPATAEEQQILARWSGWGSVPDVFAARPQQDDPVFGPGGEREGGYAAAAARWEALADVREPLRELLDDAEWRAAAASTLSAHYTPPEVTAALWQTLADLGFDGGEVLEPGSGAGVTFGTAPDSARLTGVEIDPTSAAISRLLAPGVTVLNESFADTIAPDGSFDAVVGNVPFARLTLFDPKHNKARHRIHNHFLVKSVALTRPGGVVALITSRHTMDAERDAARRELFENADLLGAVRLPNKAFARSAGTDVVTDILILRRRAEDETPGDAGWVTSTRRDLDGNTLPVSDYFTAHPEHVLGTLTSRMGAHGPEVAVEGDPDVAVALNTALRQITDRAVLDRRWYQPHPDGPHRPPLRLRPAASITDFTGRLSMDADGKLWQANSNGDPVAIDLPVAEHAQLTALIELKDLARGLNDLDRRGTDTALADAQRRTTKAAYQAYVAEYGPLSRPRQQQNATVRAEDGTERSRLTGYGYFLNDPSAYEVLALEWWEADTGTVHVSQVLDRAPATRRSVLGQHTDDPQQALTAVVAERGHVDLDHIAWMLQVEPAEARRLLARSVFTDPLTGDLVHSPDYLSGDVRTKLAIARQAARRDRAYETNVAELERVQPRDLLPGQFAIRLGAAWIPDDMVQDFFRGYLGDAHLTIQHSGGGNWHILKGRNLAEEDELRHGAGGLSALAMVAKVLNGGAMTGRPADDEEAARAVRVKADEFRDAFEAWVLDDSMRAARIADVYNQRMNARTVRDFTGSAPSLAGLDPDFTPYDHQLASAARMAHERCLVLAHVVSAGKTATMTIGMMAMRNTGQINKPMVTVPNYLVEQWEDTVRKLFPTARILALTSDDLADGKRDRMLEYIRSNDFDLIITSHSLFDSIPLSPEFHELYRNDEARLLREQIAHERRRDGKSVSLKQLEERSTQFEEELKARAAAVRTPGQVYLDDLGVDFFAVDEFHEYKNLAVRSKIPGARVKGSGKSQHVHEVLEWARMNKPTGPIGVLATGTPLSNAIGELHTLVRMANPDLLRDIDAELFDAWASMYGSMVERMEMTTDGKGFKSVERFASFHNVPAMVRQLWHPLVDYKSAEDLGLELPDIKGGEPELMLVPATADQLQRMQELGERYEAFREGGVDKSVDNPLAINNDARVIAMDSRLLDAEAEPSNKLTALVDRIIAKHEETKGNRYTYSATDKRPHPVPGALQFVFLNNGTPGGKNRGEFNAYQELKDLLVARGMPAEKIAFIHDAERADQRIKLQRDANHGGINVLVGSTMRMGKGLNAQNRAVSLYHVDPDWRPSDMAQRDGRIVRNGNQNPEVEVVWMATEGTFDSRMYGLLATKAKGFNQLYQARADGTNDEIMEVDDANLPYEEAMAIISGNPYLIEQEELRKQLRTLELDQRNRATQRAILGKRLNELRVDIETLSYGIPRRALALPLLEPVLGDDFRITLAGTAYTKHKDAAGPLMQLLTGVGQSLPASRTTTPDAKLGRLGGLDVIAVAYREDDGTVMVRLHLDGLPGLVQRSTLAELADVKGETVLRRLVKTITEAPERQIEDEGNLAAKRTTRYNLLVDRERLRGQVQGLGPARERKSLVDNLVAAQATLNKISQPSEDEPVSVTTSRREATARRDGLQQRLDRLAAAPAPEASTEAGAILDDMDAAGPRTDPSSYNPVQRDAEVALLRAHLEVHGHNPEVAARLAAFGDTAELSLPDPAPTTGPQPVPERPLTSLESLMAGFGDRVAVGHIGAPQTATETVSSGGDAPIDRQTEEEAPTPETPAAQPTPAPPPAPEDSSGEDAPEPESDTDPYGTGDLFDEFGLTRPERVPAPAPQDDPAPEEPQEDADGVPDGQMTVDDAAPAADSAPDDRYERLTSADGQLTFTLNRVPTEDVRPEAVEVYQRLRDELAAEVETRNAQGTQTREERAQELAKWRRGYKAANGLELWRPTPSLRLTPRADAPGLTPAEYALGSWVTWQDTGTGQQVTGQVMAPGANKDTWFVSTERTAVTGEYHVLSRGGKKSTGYSYSINGDTTGLRPAAGPPEPVPFENLPAVDSIPARPVASYADHVPKKGMAMVREPVPVVVGTEEIRRSIDGLEVSFDVTVDGIPFVVKQDRDDASLTTLYEIRVESDERIVALLWKEETRAAAVDAAVRAARRASELGDKPLYARGRNHRLDVAEDGVCARCNRQFDGDTGEQKLYRVDGGDATCSTHIALSLDISAREVKDLGTYRRVWAARTAPEPQTEAAPAEEPPAPELAPDEPRLVDRATVGPGDLVTVTLDVPGVIDINDREVPGAVRVTGTLNPAYRDYHPGAVLLDSVIHDADGNTVATGADVTVQRLPARIELTPAGHRADLRPEPRTAGQLRLGDLIAEGGTRGEAVTEILYANTIRGAASFSTRDAATGAANHFSLAHNFEVLVVPRERRRPQDVAEVFGRHQSHAEVAAQTRQIDERHTDLDQEAARLWPDGDGPQTELRALRRAIAAIDPEASGREGYRANAEATAVAAAAATALSDAVDDTVRFRGLGAPLHRLRQHLDVQLHRLHADVTHLEQRAQARAAANATTPASAPAAPAPPTANDRKAPMAASPQSPGSQQLGLFGGAAPDATDSDTAPGTAPVPDDGAAAPTAPTGKAGQGLPAPGPQDPGPDAGGPLPALELTPPDLDVPDLGPAEPFADDTELRADIAHLHAAYERWAQLPVVQAYLDEDQERRGDAPATPANPVAELHEVYARARGALEADNDISSPEAVLGRLYAVAAWSRALEPAVDAEMAPVLGELTATAYGLAARSQATITEFAQEMPPSPPAHGTPQATQPAPQRPVVAGEGQGDAPQMLVADEFSILYAAYRDLVTATAATDAPTRYPLGRDGVLADTETVRGLIGSGLLEHTEETAATITPAGRYRLAALANDERAEPEVGDRVVLLATGRVGIVAGYRTTGQRGRQAEVVFDREGWPDGWDFNVQPTYLTTLEAAAMTPQEAAERYRVAALRRLAGTPNDPALREEARSAFATAALSAPELERAAREGHPDEFLPALTTWMDQWATQRWANAPQDERPAWVTGLWATDDAADARNGLYAEVAEAIRPTLRRRPPEDLPVESRRLAPRWFEYAIEGQTYRAALLPDELTRGRLATLSTVIVNDGNELVGRSFGLPGDIEMRWIHTNPGTPSPSVTGWLGLGGDLMWPPYSPEERAHMQAGPPAEQIGFTLDAGPSGKPTDEKDENLADTTEPGDGNDPEHEAVVPGQGTPAPEDPEPTAPAEPAATPQEEDGPAEAGTGAPRDPAPADTAAPAPAPENPASAPQRVRGPQLALELQEGPRGQLLLQVHAEGTARMLVLPGISTADIPAGLSLPATAQLPVLTRASQLAEQLVSDEETAAWLGEHLPHGALAAAWGNDQVRAVLIVVMRNDLRDGTAPSVEDVATWLADAAAENDDLLRAAHTAAGPAGFATAFAEAADTLVAGGGSEHLLWTYLGAEGTRRAEVLALAAPQAYAQLLTLPAPAAPPEATPPAPTEPPQDAPEDSEMATPARPEEPASENDAAAVPPAPPGDDSTAQGDATDGIDVQDPPEPQPFTTSAPLAAYDQHQLHLEGMDGAGYDRGELRRDGQSIATLHRMVNGQWYARMRLDPPDLTRPVDTPETAAANAAVMHAAFTGAPLGDPVVAAPGRDIQARAEQVRSELRAFAAQHTRSIETAARELSPTYAQIPHYAELAARLADVADAEGRGARMMAADLSGVEQAVRNWGGSLPPSPGSATRTALAYPLAHMLFDVQRLQARLQATVAVAAAEVAEERTRQQQVAESAPTASETVTGEAPGSEVPAAPDTTGDTVADAAADPAEDARTSGASAPEEQTAAAAVPEESPGPEAALISDPSADTEADSSATESGGSSGAAAVPEEPPAAEAPRETPGPEKAFSSELPADDGPTMQPDLPALPDEPVAPLDDGDPVATPAEEAAAGVSADAADLPAAADDMVVLSGEPTADPVPEAETPSEEPVLSEPAAAAPDPELAAPLWGTDELPVTAYAAGEDGRELHPDSDDVLTQFRGFQAAWDDAVTNGVTSTDLFDEVRPHLTTLQGLFAEAVNGTPAPAPATSSAGPDAAPERDEHREAEAVNETLREADTRAESLQDLPEWQQIQTVRGAMGHLLTTIRKRAGDQLDQLLSDKRASGFLRELSARACDKIADAAQWAARKLRGEDGRADERGGALPSAEALLRLGDAATEFSKPRRGPGGTIPAMRKVSDAAAKLMPNGRPKVSTAAARGRSTTGKRPPAKKSTPATEQTHLRRGGPDQPQPKRPTR
ncbi:hypothetical protein ACIGD1_34415 [Streptomyces sp. NPDC085612]|uniref:hypothetical protein n=1 Tax=Streptomyces sp. NPDC085612 TaxID=3365732 RepID=UPI0037CDFB9C